MEPMKKPKVHLGICNECYEYIASKGDTALQVYLDACVYHQTQGVAAPYRILSDINPFSYEYILKQLENENFITTHETDQDLYIIPLRCGRQGTIPIYCSNRSLKCTRVYLEQNFND